MPGADLVKLELQLGLPQLRPDVCLTASIPTAEQIAAQHTLTKTFLELKPDFIINQGDTDSVKSSVIAFNKVKKK